MEFYFEGTKFERAWVRQAMEEFHADGWFTDVLYRAKGGKEANVYCCRANPAVGYDLLAAKVYRHRGQRAMKNYLMFNRLIRNVELFLACNLVHGDLSAFNVLYWKESFKIIDFPQAVDTVGNLDAFGFFARDVQRLCQYFGRSGVDADHVDISERLWKRYLRGEIRI